MVIFDLELYCKMHKIIVGLMIYKKIIAGVFFLVVLNGCAQNTVLIGPAYTFAASGNVYQAGLSFGTDKTITKLTGKSTSENIKDMLTVKEKDNEFEKLVKKQIKETRKKLNLSNQ